MNNFDQQTFEEKINTIKDEENVIIRKSWNSYLLIKSLVLAPLLIFIVMTVFYRYDDGILSVLYSVLLSAFFIFIGIILYSKMIR